MNEAQSESFRRELQRIEFRQRLMSTPEGMAWLLHVARLFGFRENILGPGDFGMPDHLRAQPHDNNNEVPTMPVHQNTNVMSRLEAKVTERLGEYGSAKVLTVSLWEDDKPITGLLDFLLNYVGLRVWRSKVYTSLAIRYSEVTGYTLEGPSWRQIHDRLDISITELFQRISDRITREYEAAHGWERTLEDTLAELDEL